MSKVQQLRALREARFSHQPRETDATPRKPSVTPSPALFSDGQANNPRPPVQTGTHVEAGKPIGSYSDEELELVVLACVAPGRSKDAVLAAAMERLGFVRKGKTIRRLVRFPVDCVR